MSKKLGDKIRDRVIKVLEGRKGFDHWWHEVDDEIKHGIKAEVSTAISDELEKYMLKQKPN